MLVMRDEQYRSAQSFNFDRLSVVRLLLWTRFRRRFASVSCKHLFRAQRDFCLRMPNPRCGVLISDCEVRHMKERNLPTQNNRECPVCGKPSYSKNGIHPQCAAVQADLPRIQKIAEEKKNATNAKKEKPSQLTTPAEHRFVQRQDCFGYRRP